MQPVVRKRVVDFLAIWPTREPAAVRGSRRCLRQRLRMMVQLDDGALLIMPVLLLPAANRQHMIEANGGVLLPELQHRLQIVRRKSDIDDALRQLHLPTITRTLCP